MKTIGAKRKTFKRDEWVIQYQDRKELANYLTLLRDNGFLFGFQREWWGAAAIFADLRKEGLVSGKCTELFWVNPNKTKTREI